MTKNVVIYARKSKYREDSGSIAAQVARCKDKIAEIQRAAPNDKYTITHILEDDGQSGKSLDRPGMSALLRLVRAGMVDVIVTYKLDRISRSLKDIFQLVEELNMLKIDLISATERDMDTTTSGGAMFFAITMVFAQLERDMARERSRDVATEMAKLGHFSGGYYPYGFDGRKEIIGKSGDGKRDKTKTVLSINEEEAAVVREVFALYLRGDHSYVRIADILNARGIPKPGKWPTTRRRQADKWIDSNIANMLCDIKYAPNDMAMYEWLNEYSVRINSKLEKDEEKIKKGETRRNKTERLRKGAVTGILLEPSDFDGTVSLQRYATQVTVLNVPALISSADWIAVQEMKLHKVLHKNHTKTGETTKALLVSGLSHCAVCGKPLTYSASPRKKDPDHGDYLCYNRDCPRVYKRIIQATLEKNVIDKLKGILTDRTYIHNLIDRDLATRTSVSREVMAAAAARAELAAIDRKVDNLVAALMDAENETIRRTITTEMEKQGNRKEKKQKELDALDAIATIPAPAAPTYDAEAVKAAVYSMGRLIDKMTYAERKILIHHLVSDLVVNSATDFELQLAPVEVLANLRNNTDTPQGVKWSKKS